MYVGKLDGDVGDGRRERNGLLLDVAITVLNVGLDLRVACNNMGILMRFLRAPRERREERERGPDCSSSNFSAFLVSSVCERVDAILANASDRQTMERNERVKERFLVLFLVQLAVAEDLGRWRSSPPSSPAMTTKMRRISTSRQTSHKR
jgi:hypothetical protein